MSDEDHARIEELTDQVTTQVLERVSAQITEAAANAASEATAKSEAAAQGILQKLQTLHDSAKNHATAITEAKTASEKAQGQAETAATQAKTALDTTNTHKDSVSSLGARAETLNTEIAALQEEVQTASTSAADFENEWEEKHSALFSKIEKLLPGAASAGLASGFRKEKKRYELKQAVASFGFIVFLVVLAAALAEGPLQLAFDPSATNGATTALDFLERTLWNLPIAGPAIWGAWWANRLSNTYDRLAEEYRQKEAISTAFEGYTKQLQDLEAKDTLKNYLSMALREICIPAGRVYDKKMPPTTPLEEQWSRGTDTATDMLNPVTGGKATSA